MRIINLFLKKLFTSKNPWTGSSKDPEVHLSKGEIRKFTNHDPGRRAVVFLVRCTTVANPTFSEQPMPNFTPQRNDLWQADTHHVVSLILPSRILYLRVILICHYLDQLYSLVSLSTSLNLALIDLFKEIRIK